MRRDPNVMTNISADALGYMIYGDEAFSERYPYILGEKTTAEDADRFLKMKFDAMLEGSALGAVILNTNYQVSLIPSDTHDTAWHRLSGDDPTYEEIAAAKHWQKDFIRAHENGIEPFSIAMKHIRRHGAEVWFSIRMNDYHYLDIPQVVSSFWKEHPEYLCSKGGVFDFSHPEVRKYRLDYIVEMCRRYDIDGIEYDLIRGDRYFAENNGMTDSEKEECLTAFLCDMREAIDKAAKESGKTKRIQVAARIYSDYDVCRTKFFRPGKWISAGAIDKLIVTNFFMPGDFNISVEDWRNRLREEGAKDGSYVLIAGTDHAARCVSWGNPMERNVRLDTDLLCGFASGAWERGADGIYLFNQFLMEEHLDFSAFTSKEAANAHDKRIVRTYKDPGKDIPMPWKSADGEQKECLLPTGKKSGKYISLLLGTVEKNAPAVSVNGCDLTDFALVCVENPGPVPYFFRYDVPIEAICDGMQKIVLRSSGENQIVWLEMDFCNTSFGKQPTGFF